MDVMGSRVDDDGDGDDGGGDGDRCGGCGNGDDSLMVRNSTCWLFDSPCRPLLPLTHTSLSVFFWFWF